MAVEHINYEECTDCCNCYDICPLDVFAVKDGRVYIAYAEDCMCCYLCEMECPSKAILVSPWRSIDIPSPF